MDPPNPTGDIESPKEATTTNTRIHQWLNPWRELQAGGFATAPLTPSRWIFLNFQLSDLATVRQSRFGKKIPLKTK
jgi:hypothetical protein